MKYITPGTVASLLTVGAVIAGALGKKELADWLGSPETAQTVGQVVVSVGALVAGALTGLKG